MDRYQLRYFLAVVDSGNFSRAAVRMNVAQPTLSAGIAKLEAGLGTRLFHRSSQRVSLTEAGARLLDRARRIESEFNLAEADIAGDTRQERLRLGVLTTIATPLVERILATHRGAAEALELVEGGERDLLNRLGRGRIDAALTILRPGVPRFADERLGSEPYLLAIPATHPLAGEKIVAPEALARDAMIVRRHCEALSETSRHFTARGVRPGFACKTTSDDRALAMIRGGLGVSVMPRGVPVAGVARPALGGFALTRDLGLLFGDALSATRRGGSPALHAVRAVIVPALGGAS